MRLLAVVSSPLTMMTSVTVMHWRPTAPFDASSSLRAVIVEVPDTFSRVFDVHDEVLPTSSPRVASTVASAACFCSSGSRRQAIAFVSVSANSAEGKKLPTPAELAARPTPCPISPPRIEDPALLLLPLGQPSALFCEDDELRAVFRLRLEAVLAASVDGMLAGVQVAGGPDPREVADLAGKALIVAVALGREQCMERVMKVVAPL